MSNSKFSTVYNSWLDIMQCINHSKNISGAAPQLIASLQAARPACRAMMPSQTVALNVSPELILFPLRAADRGAYVRSRLADHGCVAGHWCGHCAGGAG